MYDAALVQRVMAVLDLYFAALENGEAERIAPAPNYQWQYWPQISLEWMRQRIKSLDEYWWQQHTWGRLREYEAGPDLSRLPDGALIAMFQELDAIFAHEEEERRRKAPPPPPPSVAESDIWPYE